MSRPDFHIARNVMRSAKGNSLKLLKPRHRLNVRGNYFANRVVNLWNSLPDNVVTAPSIDSFKRRLDKHWAALPSMRSISLCPRLFVPTSLCAHVSICPKSGILCPRLFVPKKVVFCAHVSLCPKKWYFVPQKVVFCAHVSLCPKKWYFVPTSLCAYVSICPNLCQWELWVGSLNRPVVKQWLN